MCSNNNENSCSCFTDILCTIVALQKKINCKDASMCSCSKPYLGGDVLTSSYNTRPITIYNCCNSELWRVAYTLNGEPGRSTVFRIENVEDCCATFRVLAANPEATTLSPYVLTDSFFTINLNCIGALKCLDDVYVSGI